MGAPPQSPIAVPHFRFRRGALEPSGIWLTRDDVLILRADFEAGDFLDVEARIRVLSPTLKTEDFRLRAHYAAGESNPQIVQVTAPEGFLQGAVITQLGDFTETAPFTYPTGRVYAQLTVGKGLIPGGYEHTLVCAGYVTGHTSVGWPGGRAENAGDGAGRIRRIALANPGAGIVWRYQPVEVYVELLAGTFNYTTSAAAGNRQVGVRSTDGIDSSFFTFAPAIQGPSLVQRYNFGPGIPFLTNATGPAVQHFLAWPVGMVTERGASLEGYVAGGMPAGDTMTSVVLSVRTWTI